MPSQGVVWVKMAMRAAVVGRSMGRLMDILEGVGLLPLKLQILELRRRAIEGLDLGHSSVGHWEYQRCLPTGADRVPRPA